MDLDGGTRAKGKVEYDVNALEKVERTKRQVAAAKRKAAKEELLLRGPQRSPQSSPQRSPQRSAGSRLAGSRSAGRASRQRVFSRQTPIGMSAQRPKDIKVKVSVQSVQDKQNQIKNLQSQLAQCNNELIIANSKIGAKKGAVTVEDCIINASSVDNTELTTKCDAFIQGMTQQQYDEFDAVLPKKQDIQERLRLVHDFKKSRREIYQEQGRFKSTVLQHIIDINKYRIRKNINKPPESTSFYDFYVSEHSKATHAIPQKAPQPKPTSKPKITSKPKPTSKPKSPPRAKLAMPQLGLLQTVNGTDPEAVYTFVDKIRRKLKYGALKPDQIVGEFNQIKGLPQHIREKYMTLVQNPELPMPEKPY